MLTIYSGVTPNVKHNTHYYFNVLATYKAHILSLANAHKDYALNNYRINNGYISITQESNFDYNSVTYAILDEDFNKVCYLVDRVLIQSGYVTLYVSVDLWASYIYKARITDIFINKCNRNIGEGIYTLIKATKGDLIIKIATGSYVNDDDGHGYMNDSRFSLVIALNYNAKQNITGSDTIATTSLFAIGLDVLRNAYDALKGDRPVQEEGESDSDYQIRLNQWLESLYSYNFGSIGIASDFAGGVYGVDASFSKNDARTLKAWIIDNRLINESGLNINISSASLITSGHTFTISARKINTSDLRTSFSLLKRLNEIAYFGGLNDGFEVTRFTQGDYYNVRLRVFVNVSDLRIIAYDGNNQKDITDAFELVLTNNVSITTPIRAVATALEKSVGAYKSIVKSGYVGALNALAGLVGEYGIDQQIIGNGDAEAIMNMRYNVGLVKPPYNFTCYTSANDEEALARTEGADFNLYFSGNFDTLFNYSLLGNLQDFNDTYLKGYASVDGIPNDARAYIQDAILEGVYLQQL